MKNRNKYLWPVILIAALVSCGLVSCEDDGEATPSVTNVRVIAKDSSIVGGEFGLPIAI